MMTIEDVKNYEIGFLSKNERCGEEMEKVLKNHDFSIVYSGRTIKIKLAYPIKKENFAFFDYLYFSGDPKNIAGLDKKLKMGSEILRFLIIVSPTLPEEREKKPVADPGQPEISTQTEQVSQPAVKREVKKPELLSNEALEKRLEEILK